MELTNETDHTLRSIDILTVFLKDEETPGGGPSRVHAAIEETTCEREWAESLILRFTAISSYGAVETLNRGKFRGHDSWELRAGGVCTNGGTDSERITIQDAVASASLLRREEHIAQMAARRATPTNSALSIFGNPERHRRPEGSAR